ncbi:MAG: NADH:ubiquinone reductase (Na(+)-transporting) subunit F [Flavobacteriales bacterium]|nr:NADH:ubiquinone reductase (Na(+)-transporting) subunit F [Flavobacteriales bacterium]MCW8913379.1 NADH:ubiquinone reductase (Na(+)-transporting) subunit F [Flavobacteriales bacterium]MCW8938557.1 NADH:ubiquinone reductase (Na(+)-transporting) subunit F [Flavobacteriales bacterium]MCW8939745.1 NADH:ubiquinone reductase (Na(+)-transporting) subunit F [Flavobacteriales bacterium]MCW8969456.1 NADH:ubiquinone reductase (Na(+)-transporting) subunit F [Flavobacteriales bacterium]
MFLAISTATIIVAVIVFTIVTLLLVLLLLWAKSKLTSSGPVKITINHDKILEVEAGSTLLNTLSNQGIFLPSACGGGGTCIQCKCEVKSGGGSILPTEEPHFSRKEIAQGMRLGCQVKVKEDMEIEIEEEILGIKEWEATVVSNYNVATFIKEFIVEIPEDMDYKAGGYIQIKIPPCTIKYKEMDVTAHPQDHPGEPDKFKPDWDKFKLWPLVMKNDEEVIRAYSMASYPAEGRKIMLNVRIATPPFDRDKGDWMDVNPGVASSYIFNQKQGDKVVISGPYGEFFINHSDAEMLYIGGGAGMAPMRSHLYELFKTIKTNRKVTYWYGGRSKAELFYIHYFRDLEKDFPNFKFYLALSEPLESDNWKVKKDIHDEEGDGFVGFIHQVVIDQYLTKHDAPEDIEFYFCGPPLMNNAVTKMCDDWGVPPENVRFDDFGG